MNGFSWLRRLLRSERGNVLVIGATTIPLIIGAGAVGLDTIQYSLWKRQLQRAADSSAIAGAYALSQSGGADDPNAFTLDHVKPLSLYPDLAEVETNQRAAHRRCNLGRGNRAPALSLGEPSRRW